MIVLMKNILFRMLKVNLKNSLIKLNGLIHKKMLTKDLLIKFE